MSQQILVGIRLLGRLGVHAVVHLLARARMHLGACAAPHAWADAATVAINMRNLLGWPRLGWLKIASTTLTYINM